MSQFAKAHDSLLRGVIKSKGLSLADWFKVLDGAGIQKGGFLAGLAYLQDEKQFSHDDATALAWAYLNPNVLPDDLAKTLPGYAQSAQSAMSDDDEFGDESEGGDDDEAEPVTTVTVATKTVVVSKAVKSVAKPASKPVAKAPAKKKPSAKPAKKAAPKKAAPKKKARRR